MTTPTAKKKAAAKKKTHRSAGRRFTIEQQQEYRSRAQFDDRISDFGWVVNTKERDHGEDVLVDIYDDGLSAGISFLAQLKSTGELSRFVSKKGKRKAIHYRLDVDDVLHWEVAAHLIVVVIWDVAAKKGVWLTVPEIIGKLDADPSWRKQETKTIEIPLANGTDDKSLRRLRRLVADRNLPIVGKGKPLEIKFKVAFPTSAAGIKAAAAARAALDYGESARIDGSFIKTWKMPDWWERIYGPEMPDYVTIGPLSESDAQLVVPIRFEIDTPSGTHSVAFDLRRTKAGKKGFTLTNEHQKLPATLALVGKLEGDGLRFNISIGVQHPVADIFKTKDATDLLLALMTGSRMRLVQRETGQRIVETEVPPIANHTHESLERWRTFLAKLCEIQRRVYAHGSIKIGKGRISPRAAQLVDDFYKICTTGFIERSMSISAQFDLSDGTWQKLVPRIRNGERVEFGFDTPEAGEMKILNVMVPLGPVRVRHDAGCFVDQIDAALAEGKTSVKVTTPAVRVREEYSNWAPGSGSSAPSDQPRDKTNASHAAAPAVRKGHKARQSRSKNGDTFR